MTPSLHVVEAGRVSAQPWRNGGGITRELCTWPPGAAWQVRVSVADITRDGPFSAFPGVDRWFAVVEGAAVALQFAAGRHMLGPDSAPLLFDGALAPHCHLQAGPTRDLNLMSQRAAGRSTLRRLQEGEHAVTCRAHWCALFTAEPLQLQVATEALLLPAWALAVGTGPSGASWQVRGAGPRPRAWWLAFENHPQAAA